jgi:hypothetical protein
MKLALKITPQRSTQYTNMVETLAKPELVASPLEEAIREVEQVTLAGQSYLLVTLDDDLVPPNTIALLSRLGATSETFDYFEQVGEVRGPLLRPHDPEFTPFVPFEMAETRRYKGKTNEVFTRVLLNLAIFAGAYADRFTERLRILDPLAGGGTTLFLALISGYDAFGIELDRQDGETTALFVRQYLRSEGIHFKETDERGRKAGRRYQFDIGNRGDTRTLVLVQGDAAQADSHMREVPGGPHMHAIVTDLPYGIQHFGEIAKLLDSTLPTWERLLLPGGAMALSWNATRIERASMIELFEQHTKLHIMKSPPYTELPHTVDRVIKRRDVLVAVKNSNAPFTSE